MSHTWTRVLTCGSLLSSCTCLVPPCIADLDGFWSLESHHRWGVDRLCTRFLARVGRCGCKFHQARHDSNLRWLSGSFCVDNARLNTAHMLTFMLCEGVVRVLQPSSLRDKWWDVQRLEEVVVQSQNAIHLNLGAYLGAFTYYEYTLCYNTKANKANACQCTAYR